MQMARRWTIQPVEYPADICGAVRSLAARGEVAWLDSAVSDCREHAGPEPGASLVCWKPVAVLEQLDQEPARCRTERGVVAKNPNGWELWRAVHQGLPRLAATRFGISPGWVGYVGFETAGQLERLPGRHRQDLGLPLMRLGLFDAGVVLDHATQRAWLLRTDALGERFGLRAASAGSLARQWSDACAARPAPRTEVHPPPRVTHEMSRDTYENLVRRALEYIRAGDTYQVNLAQRLRIDGVADIVAAYACVRRHNPANYAALLHWDAGAVASFSPELMLRLRGDVVLTRPIKGTRPRTDEPEVDAAHRADLLTSAKDAAELAMIVDLHRNDLGRVCEYGSVRVMEARGLELHPTVIHTVADVVGRLRAACDGLDLLRACFPAGSVTGAPKLRAIEIIDELEPCARGVFTGTIGVLGLDGTMTCNVAIRTLQHRGNRATLHLGGGIVADSIPSDEYEETLAKGRGILSGLGCEAARAAPGGSTIRSSLSETRRA